MFMSLLIMSMLSGVVSLFFVRRRKDEYAFVLAVTSVIFYLLSFFY